MGLAAPSLRHCQLNGQALAIGIMSAVMIQMFVS